MKQTSQRKNNSRSMASTMSNFKQANMFFFVSKSDATHPSCKPFFSDVDQTYFDLDLNTGFAGHPLTDKLKRLGCCALTPSALG